LPPLFDVMRRRSPGQINRVDDHWALLLRDLEARTPGAMPMMHVVHEADAGPDGYVSYRVTRPPSDHIFLPTAELKVADLVSLSGEARVALWDYLVHVDLVATVSAPVLPVDEPVRHLLADPRQ